MRNPSFQNKRIKKKEKKKKKKKKKEKRIEAQRRV